MAGRKSAAKHRSGCKRRRLWRVFSLFLLALLLAANAGATPLRPTVYTHHVRQAFAAPSAADAGKPLVIILPGVMGSKLMRQSTGEVIWPPNLVAVDASVRALACVPPADAIVPVAEGYGVSDQYASLCIAARDAGYDVIFMPYDWRKSIDDAAATLDELLNLYPNRRTALIGHSMGGLVIARALDERAPERAAAVVTVATPYFGSAKSLYVGTYGEPLGDPFAPQLTDAFNSILNDALREAVLAITPTLPSFYELLPAQAYGPWLLTETPDGAPLMLDDYHGMAFDPALKAQAERLQASLAAAAMPADTWRAVYGVGYRTVSGYTLNERGEMAEPFFEDGDGNVTVRSATRNGAFSDVHAVEGSHMALISDDEVVDYVIATLKEVFP